MLQGQVERLAEMGMEGREALIRLEERSKIETPKCPQPGLCLTLTESFEKIQDRVFSLETTRSEERGARRARLAIMGLVGFIAGLIGAILPLLIHA